MDPLPNTILMLVVSSLFCFHVFSVDVKDISSKLSRDINLIQSEELGVPFIEVCIAIVYCILKK